MRALALLLTAGVLTGTAAAAAKPRLLGAFDVVVEPSGALLVADRSNRVFRANGRTLTVVAGSGRFGRSGDSRPAVRANVGFPVEVAIDPRGGFGIVSEEAHIRLVSARGRITTLARGLAQPTALSFDAQGNVYFSELGGRIGRIDRASRAVTTIADGLSRSRSSCWCSRRPAARPRARGSLRRSGSSSPVPSRSTRRAGSPSATGP